MDTDKILNRFWSKVKQGGPDDCWPWIGALSKGQYGEFNIEGRIVRAHRLAYTLKKGPIPEHLNVCHHCDNTICCNPNHLFVGTQFDNIQDGVQKGRIKGSLIRPLLQYAKGPKKFYEGEIDLICKLAKAGYMSAFIGKMFKSSVSIIDSVIRYPTHYKSYKKLESAGG